MLTVCSLVMPPWTPLTWSHVSWRQQINSFYWKQLKGFYSTLSSLFNSFNIYLSRSIFIVIYTRSIHICMYIYLLNSSSVSNIFHNNFDSCHLMQHTFNFAQCTLRTWIICTEDLTVKCSSPRCQQLLNYYQLQTLYFIKKICYYFNFVYTNFFGFDQGSW